MNILQYTYADKCLYKAATTLATGQGKLKERLTDAYNFHLIHIEPSYFPEHLQQKFLDIQNKLTKNHTKTVKETIHFWKKSKTWLMANNIFDLFCSLDYFYKSGGKT